MIVTVPLPKEYEQMLILLKQKRLTNNSAQILREALWEYAKKILPEVYLMSKTKTILNKT